MRCERGHASPAIHKLFGNKCCYNINKQLQFHEHDGAEEVTSPTSRHGEVHNALSGRCKYCYVLNVPKGTSKQTEQTLS